MQTEGNFLKEKLLHLAGLDGESEKDKDISEELEIISEFVRMADENMLFEDIREKTDISLLRDDIKSKDAYDRKSMLENASLKNGEYICVPKIL